LSLCTLVRYILYGIRNEEHQNSASYKWRYQVRLAIEHDIVYAL